MKLTKRQREELELLAVQPRSTNNTRFDFTPPRRHRRNCARVQNSLQALELAYFCDEDGVQRDISVAVVLASYGNPRPQCRITDKGRELLANLKRGGSK